MSVAPNSRASFCRGFVTAHRDDPLRAHLLRGEHAEQADRAVADDHDRRARLHVGRIGGEPAGAHDVGERQQARDQFVRGHIRRRHQRAVRERNAQQRRLRRADQLAMLAGRLIAGRQWGQVLSEAKNEPMTNWPGLTVLTALPTSSTMPQYSWPIGVGCVIGLMPR